MVPIVRLFAVFSLLSLCSAFLRYVAPRKVVVALGVGRARPVLSAGKDELEGLKVDETKLSLEERERLAFIQKLTLEADDMIRKAGFNIDGEQDAEEIERAVKDTKWSGQSDVEKSIASANNFEDLTNRRGLALVDLLAFLTFAFVGRSNHGENIDLVAVLFTAVPFLLSWFTVAPFAGAYSRKSTASKGSIPQGVVLGWGLSVPLALAIRGLLKNAVPPTPFIIVSLVATFSLLVAFRFVFVFLVGETSDEETKSAGAFEVFKMVKTLIRRW